MLWLRCCPESLSDGLYQANDRLSAKTLTSSCVSLANIQQPDVTNKTLQGLEVRPNSARIGGYQWGGDYQLYLSFRHFVKLSFRNPLLKRQRVLSCNAVGGDQ